MRHYLILLITVLILSFTGCASLVGQTINIGESEQEVIAKLGAPTSRYQAGTNTLLEYARGPWGQQTYMARINENGRLVSYQQVLTVQNFAAIEIGKSTKSDVLRTIGKPGEKSYLDLPKLEVWSYAYKENDAWNSAMHVHFDQAGIVQKMLNAPDRRFDPDGHFPDGLSM